MGLFQKRRTARELAPVAWKSNANAEDFATAAVQLRGIVESKTAMVAWGKRLQPTLAIDRDDGTSVTIRSELRHPSKGAWGDSYTFNLVWQHERVVCSSRATTLTDGSIADRNQFNAAKSAIGDVLRSIDPGTRLVEGELP